MKFLLRFLICLLPWPLRRSALVRLFGYQIHPSARIGLSWIFPDSLAMEQGARIGHFNVAIHLKRLCMGEQATIGRRNWITGFPKGTGSQHFKHQPEREPELIIGAHAAITKNHHIDCTNRIEIGAFTTVAGYFSQLLTHSIDIFENRQDSRPIKIGDYCFIGTNVVILGGATLPDYSVVGAKALVSQKFEEPYNLYGGVPAKALKRLPESTKYFSRDTGWVD